MDSGVVKTMWRAVEDDPPSCRCRDRYWVRRKVLAKRGEDAIADKDDNDTPLLVVIGQSANILCPGADLVEVNGENASQTVVVVGLQTLKRVKSNKVIQDICRIFLDLLGSNNLLFMVLVNLS